MQVFISYRRQDADFAERLRSRLHTLGYRTWMDKYDIPDGEYWPDAIDAGLRASDVIIGLMSPEAVLSRNVKNEWDWALTHEKKLLLLLIRPCDNIPHRYISVNYIDFTQNETEGFAHLNVSLDGQSGTYRDSQEVPAVQHFVPVKPKQPTQPKVETDRSRMLQNVYNNWIVGFLDNALYESRALAMELDIAAPGSVLKHIDYKDYALPNSASIIEVFEDMRRELLILGVPGSGKTILLLQLARELLEQAKEDEQESIPVVLNLASWAAQRKPLEDWLLEEIISNYQAPAKLINQWIEHEQLLLLLDGLDEVKEEYRNACLDAINTFRSKYTSVDMAVCSRIADYEALTGRLNLQGAIVLNPLTEQQINSYISAPDLAGLREAMQKDTTLRELAQTPFLLNTMSFAYRNVPLMGLQLPVGETDRKGRLKHIFNAYVERRLKHVSEEKGLYTPRQARHYLAWLAHKIVEQRQIIFYIEGLQPDWLPSEYQRRYQIGVWLTVALVYGVGTWITFVLGFLFGLIGQAGVSNGMLVGVAVAGASTLFAIVFGTTIRVANQLRGEGTIRSTERLSLVLSWRSILSGLLIGLVAALAAFVYGSVSFTLMFGLTFWVFGTLAFSLRAGERVDTRTRPNQGIRRSAINAVRIGFAIGTIVGLTSGFGIGLVFTSVAGLGFGLIYGLGWAFTIGLGAGLAVGVGVAGGQAVIKHLVLRELLYRKGYLPANLTKFLDYTVSRIIMRRVGGGYIFVHRYLLEYLAETDQ